MQQAEEIGRGLDKVSRGRQAKGPMGMQFPEPQIGLALARGLGIESQFGMGAS